MRFNYPYLSLSNCKCYCWSHELSRPLKIPSDFPDSVLSTGGKQYCQCHRGPPLFGPQRCADCVCDILEDPVCGFLFVSYRLKKGNWLSGCHPGKRGKASWESCLTSLVFHPVTCPQVSGLGVSGGKWKVWRHGRMGKAVTRVGTPQGLSKDRGKCPETGAARLRTQQEQRPP